MPHDMVDVSRCTGLRFDSPQELASLTCGGRQLESIGLNRSTASRLTRARRSVLRRASRV